MYIKYHLYQKQVIQDAIHQYKAILNTNIYFILCAMGCQSKIKYTFKKFANELDIDNGSEEFHSFRRGKISASRIGAVANLGGYSRIWWQAEHYFDPPVPNEHTQRGVEREPLIREELIQKTGILIRTCGIFYIPGTRFTAMPDDIAYIEYFRDSTGELHYIGEEVIIEYKCPVRSPLHVHTDYICQVVWQMGITGLKHAFLVYSAMNRTPGTDQFQIYHVDFDQTFFEYLVECANEFSFYLDSECLPEYAPRRPWLYPEASKLIKEGKWVHGVDYSHLGVPTPPPFEYLSPANLMVTCC